MIRGVDIDKDYTSPEEEMALVGGGPGPGLEVNDRVINLLVWFKQIRYAAKCFEYIVKARPNFGDAGKSCRRALLVLKLTCAQREEFSIYPLDVSAIYGISSLLSADLCLFSSFLYRRKSFLWR